MSAFRLRHKKRKLHAEINAVPYIDVKLVLLVIFMVTAPLMNLGVDVDLPDSDARPTEQTQDPVIVSITADGLYTLTLADSDPEPITPAALAATMRAFVATNPEVRVFVAADGALSYQDIMDAMALLQGAGVPRVGLMSEPRQAPR